MVQFYQISYYPTSYFIDRRHWTSFQIVQVIIKYLLIASYLQ